MTYWLADSMELVAPKAVVPTVFLLAHNCWILLHELCTLSAVWPDKSHNEQLKLLADCCQSWIGSRDFQHLAPTRILTDIASGNSISSTPATRTARSITSAQHGYDETVMLMIRCKSERCVNKQQVEQQTRRCRNPFYRWMNIKKEEKFEVGRF